MFDLPTTPTEGVLAWQSGPNTQNPGLVREVFATWCLGPCVSGYSDTPDHRKMQMHAEALGLQVPVESVLFFKSSRVVAVPRRPNGPWHAAPSTANPDTETTASAPDQSSNTLRTDFAARVHSEMQRRGITSVDVARLSDVAQSLIWRLVNNGADPILSTAVKIAQALDIPLANPIARPHRDADEAWSRFYNSTDPAFRQYMFREQFMAGFEAGRDS